MARAQKKLLICIDNEGYEVSLERRKIYVALPDTTASKRGHVRVVDESGEDYLYPKTMFIPVELPLATRKAVLADA
ncbi:MAG: hypothetical protein K8S25_13860 [Alphaproteobacteria bacterium]|nr:hypothetical protein [Alphaproteobacteria bacterium]